MINLKKILIHVHGKKKVAQRPMDEDMLNLQLTNRKGTFIPVISVKAQQHVL